MLGPLAIQGDDLEITRFRTRRVALLLAYLGLFPSRNHFRDEVGDLLWPEADDEVLRRNLRQAMSTLRKALEPPPVPYGTVLQTQQGRLRLNPEAIETDVVEFERAAARGKSGSAETRLASLKAAVGLYSAHLLPGFDDDWIFQERLRLEDLYLSTLHQLTKTLVTLGQVEETIPYLKQAIGLDPFVEDSYLELMRSYIQIGRPNEAIRLYDQLQSQLSEGLGQEPSALATKLHLKAKSISPLDPAIQVPADAPINPEQNVIPAIHVPTVRLPVQVTKFCGRQDEIDRTIDQFARRRAKIVTLVGPAGTGKTRLSIEIGQKLPPDESWSVWFVPLSDLATGAMAEDAVLDTFKARRSGRADPMDRMVEAVSQAGNSLLILDNAEHMVEEVAALVQRLGERVPDLQILVTSRQPLRIAGEHLVLVPPLPIPYIGEGSGAVSPEEAAAFARIPSVQLFVDRCQMIRPDFQLTVNNARSISAICAQLDGMPLALELAAGLSTAFSPAQMLHHLHRRLTHLTSRRRDLPERHRSLRAAIDYSFDSLDRRLQEFFVSLSVFRGGITVEAAHFVFGRDRADDVSIQQIGEQLWELQERSLLKAEDAQESSTLRFRMLEAFRQYGEERVSEEEWLRLRSRHAEFFRSNPPPDSSSMPLEERTRRHLWIEEESDNYAAAVEFQFAEGRDEECISLLGALQNTWFNRGPRQFERSFIRKIADRVDQQSIDPNSKILLLRMLGTTYIRSAEYAAAHRACERALAVAKASGLEEQEIVCLLGMATCSGYLGNLDECLELSTLALLRLPEGSHMLRERALLGVGAVMWGKGRLQEAETAFKGAAELSAQARGGEADVLILNNIARVCLDLGRFDEAMTRLGEAARVARRMHDDFGLAISFSLTSRYHRLHGQFEEALGNGREALLLFREMDFLQYSLVSLFQHGLALVDAGNHASGLQLLAAASGVGLEARQPDKLDFEFATAKIRATLSPAQFDLAWAKGLSMGTEEAFRFALNTIE